MHIYKKIIILSYFSFLLLILLLPTNSSLAILVCGAGEIPAPDGASCITPNNGGLIDVIQKLQGLLNAIVPLLVALGVVYFVWGVVQYVVGDGEEAKTKGRDRMIYGIIGLAVIIGVWGLVGILLSTFDISGGTAPDVSNLLPQ